MNDRKPPRYFLIAGEPSGDALGASLMAGLSELQPDAVFDGIGGRGMARQGLTSRFPMEELSLMGMWEVLPKYRHLKRRIAETAQAVAEAAPDALITIDSPDFCLRVAKAARTLRPDLKTVHYVAPSVWAWRPGRAAKMAPVIDHVLALLPFEPPLMQAAGMTCDFVGHPVATMPVATSEQAQSFRQAHSLGPETPLVLCLPGSRRSEVTRLSARFDETLGILRQRYPDMQVVLPTVPSLAPMVCDIVAAWQLPPLVVETDAEKQAAFASAHLALAASGTVSLELAANRVPMVIGYDMAPVSRVLMGLLMRTDTVTLVNLVSGTRTVPEFLGRACQPEPMAKSLEQLMSEGKARQAQLAAMDQTMDLLGRGGESPGLRAARSVLAAVSARTGVQVD